MAGTRSRVWCFTLFVQPSPAVIQRFAPADVRREAGEAGSEDESDNGGSHQRPRCSAPAAVRGVLSASGIFDDSDSSDSPSQAEARTARDLQNKLQHCHQLIYYIFQEEEAPTTRRRHFQGYLRFTGGKTLASVKKVFTPWLDVHLEVARGSADSNIAYCSKPESRVAGPYEYGEAPKKQGKRSDLEDVRDLITQGCGMKEVAAVCSSYQALKFGETLLKYIEPGRNFLTEVRWYHGSTGSGKTRAALDEYPDAWISARNLKWWDGYDAHEHVIIDDFRKDFCTFHELLRILDRYPYRIETKGGSRQLLAKVIIITCPWDPEVLFTGRSVEDVGQLLRRITVIKQFGDIVPPPVLIIDGPTSRHFRS